MKLQNSSRGFTLIELMIALVAGLIVSYAVVAFTMASMKSNAEYVQSTKLTQTLRNTLDLVVRDLRRAGYDDAAVTRLAGGADSPAVGTSPFTAMLLDNSNPSPTNGSCIIYAYDRPAGTLGPGKLDIDTGEVRGLRRVQITPTGATAPVGVIEYATSAGSKPTCGGATAVYTSYPPTCNSTSLWCPLTDSATINIQQFSISEPAPTSPIVGLNPSAIRIRNLEVAISARLVGDSGTLLADGTYLTGVSTSYARGVQATVKVRSDCVKSTVANCILSP